MKLEAQLFIYSFFLLLLGKDGRRRRTSASTSAALGRTDIVLE